MNIHLCFDNYYIASCYVIKHNVQQFLSIISFAVNNYSINFFVFLNISFVLYNIYVSIDSKILAIYKNIYFFHEFFNLKVTIL